MRLHTLSFMCVSLISLMGCVGTPPDLRGWQGKPVDQILAQWGSPRYSEYRYYRWIKCRPYSSSDHYINGMYQGTSTRQMCSTYNVYFDPQTRIIKRLSEDVGIY